MRSHKHSKPPEQPSGERENRQRQDEQPIAPPKPAGENSHHPPINSIPGRHFSQDQFVREMQVAGFIGAYKFWSIVAKEDDGNLRKYANGLLQGLAQIAMRHRRDRPWTPEEEEAFRYCGIVELK